jgi:hypothetical protein
LPLNDSRMNVSSPSTIPVNALGLSPAREARNLCLQRNAVHAAPLHRLSGADTVVMALVCAAHLSFMRKFANGVFVRESWPGKSAQCDKWNFCLKAAMIAAEQEQR